MNVLRQDLRYAFRKLTRRPGFTAVAVVALALGIGANTSIFSVVNAVLVRPLPFKDPGQLIVIWETNLEQGRERDQASAANFLDWRDQSRSFEDMFAWAYWSHTLTGVAEPENIASIRASANIFSVLGVEAALGRTFVAEEGEAGREKVVVLSHGYWVRRFGGDPTVVGRTLELHGEAHSIVGVMPPDFRFPDDEGIELWLPVAFAPSELTGRARRLFNVMGRLADGATLDQAQAELDAIALGLAEDYGDSNAGWGVTIERAKDLLQEANQHLLILLGAVGFVLLIACANVANLLLARAAEREREIAIRRALGAGRLSLMRQLLFESLALAVLGGGAALLLSVWGVDLILALEPGEIPGWNHVGVDVNVLIFTAMLAVVTALIAGMVPALQASSPDLAESLKEGSAKFTGAASGRKARSALVVSEVALAVVLLVGAGLLIRSFSRLLNVDPDYSTDKILSTSIFLPETRYTNETQEHAFFRDLVERVENLPGVVAAGASTAPPMNAVGIDFDLPFDIDGQQPHEPGKAPQADYRVVTPGYLGVMGIPLLRGRALTDADRQGVPRVMMINETMARRFFAGEDPIGRRVRIPIGDWHEVIGVVGNIRHRGLDSEQRPEVYVSYHQKMLGGMVLVAKTAGDPHDLAKPVERQVFALDPELAVTRITTMAELVSDSVAKRRFNMLLLGSFAGLALVLAVIGIYGVISYTVSRRTREIGVRMAMGARRRDVVRMVLLDGLALAGAGVAIGTVGAFAVTRLLDSLLFEISPADPVTFVGVPLVLLAASLVACYLPALRATRVDPVLALRYE